MRAPRHRNICFTINADGENPLLLLDFEHDTWQHVKFCVYQRELGSHEHFQGYMEFSEQMTFSAIVAMEGMEHAHLEARRGSAKQASHYCRKPDPTCDCNVCNAERAEPTYVEGPWEFGVMSAQGQRAELMEIQRELDRGASLLRIATEHFPEYVRFSKAFIDYSRLISEKRDFKPVVLLLVGPSGTGKTRTALRIARYLGSVYLVPSKHTGFWCDDYAGEDVFMIDEMNGDKMKPEFFNGLVDRYEFVLPIHGQGGHQFNSKYIIICSNYAPKFWWKRRSENQVYQTMRRIDWVMKFIPPKPRLIAPVFRMLGRSHLLSDYQ